MTQHRHERVALVGRPERDFPAGGPGEDGGVVRVLGEAGGGAVAGGSVVERNAGGNVDPSENSLLGAGREQVVEGQELQEARLGGGAEAVQLDALGVVEVEVFRLRGGEDIPVMQEGRRVDALLGVEFANEALGQGVQLSVRRCRGE